MIYLFYVLALGLAPVAFVFTFIYLKDHDYDREPLKHLIISFVLGIVIAVPAVFGEIFLQSLFGVSEGPNVGETLIYAMVVVAAVEEGLKFLVLRFYMFNKPEFDEPYDGIMYAVAISLGFAAIENLLYISQYGTGVGWLRMFTSIPGHAMFAVIMGYFVGNAKFMPDKGKANLEMMKGLFTAIVVHGLYDFFLMIETNYVLVPLLAFVVLIVGIILGLRAIKAHREISPFADGGAAMAEVGLEAVPVSNPTEPEGEVNPDLLRREPPKEGGLTGSLVEKDEHLPGPDDTV